MATDGGEGAEKPKLQVDIVSDMVCPWCALGWKQFEAALERLGEKAEGRIDIRWRSFLLNPQTPPGGRNYREHIAAKYGRSPEEGDEMRAQLTAMGAELGFTYNFTENSRTWNTDLAHQLLHWAKAEGRQHALKLAMLKAHFTDNRAMDDPATLAAIAGEAGLDAEEAAKVLADGRFAEAVAQEAGMWPQVGIQGVPAFIFNERQAMVGAQSVDTFEMVLTELLTPPQEE